MMKSTLFLVALFILALLPRMYGAHTVGYGWDYPGSFTLINFDEAGSCRAALQGFEYSTFVGRQTVVISEMLGSPVSEGVMGDPKAAKAYCHSQAHIAVARSYSAVAGALTVVLIGIIALLLLPAQPQVAWTASALLALSGFHISESQTGTVDAPSVFFIYLFFTVLVYAVKRRNTAAAVVSPIFMLAAVWAKYWVFALLAYLGAVSSQFWAYLGEGLSRSRVVVLMFAAVIVFALLTNSDFNVARWYPVLALYYLFVPWRKIRRVLIPVFLALPAVAYALSQVGVIADFSTGQMTSNFGTGYAAIGANKWLRNILNIPFVLIVGLGLPAFFFLPAGFRAIFRDRANAHAWLCLSPVILFALYMMFIAPVTYYRHYLALIPAAALVSSYGLWSAPFVRKRWFLPLFLPLFLLWPALLAVDFLQDYQSDPRKELRQWYREHPQARVFISYYVSPSPQGMAQSKFFRPEYAFDGGKILKQASHLILSENWYDTAFANELNGPVTRFPTRLIKTKPQYAQFYQQVLAGQHPNLKLERAIDVQNFMPELVFHKWFYGTFQMFVGDIKIYTVVD